MKKLIVLFTAMLSFSYAMAQQEMDFPFQGGSQVMTDYFTKNLQPTELMKQIAATGTVIMKFTADEKGSILKMVVYYADDASLVEPVVSALKGTDGKWIIPAKRKFFDFVVPFSINIDSPNSRAAKYILQFYNTRTPITATDQVPLNEASLLPTVQMKYIYDVPVEMPVVKKAKKQGK